MNKFLTLTRVLLKSNSGLSTGRKKSRRSLGIIILILAFAPMIALSTASFMGAYSMLEKAGAARDMLAAMMTVSCGAMILFGIMYVISTYYFSDDVATLITMPIPPRGILGAKFVVVCIFQYFVEIIVMLPCVVAFGVMRGSVIYWIYALLTLILLPVIPTVVCSVISVLLMAFGKLFRNKDRMRIFAGIIAILFAVGINVFTQSMTGSSNSSNTTAAMLASSIPALHSTALACPWTILAADAMLGAPSVAGAAEMLLFIAANAAALALFLWLGDRLYLRGVVGLTENMPSRRKNARKSAKEADRSRSTTFALVMKDWRILLRTPSYMLNCVLSALVFPPLMVVILALSMRQLDIGKYSLTFLFVAICSGAAAFFSVMNMASATAVSREGKNIDVSRYIPVPYRTQVRAKLIPGLLLSLVSLILTLVPAGIIFRIAPLSIGAIFFVCAAALAGFNAFGLYVDVTSPKLDWEDENAAVKNNLNVGVQLLVMMVAMCVMPVLPALLKLGFFGGTVMLLCEYVLLAVGAFALLFGRGVDAFASGAALETDNVKSSKKQKVRTLAARGTPAGTDKTKRTKIAVIVAASAVLAAVFGIFLFSEFTAVTEVAVTQSTVQVKSATESSSFSIQDIKNTTLEDSMPAASKRNGFNSGDVMRGVFSVEGLGVGHVYTQSAKGPFLLVTLRSGGFYIFNYSDASKTQALYTMLKSYAGSE